MGIQFVEGEIDVCVCVCVCVCVGVGVGVGVVGEAMAGRMDVPRKFPVWIAVAVVNDAAGMASGTLTAISPIIRHFSISPTDSIDRAHSLMLYKSNQHTHAIINTGLTHIPC